MRLIFSLATIVTMLGCSSGPTTPTPTPTPTPPPVPLIIGQWTGRYTVTSCTETGSAIGSDFCRNLGTGGLHTFTPQQAGSSVTGFVAFGGLSIPVTGTVDAAGAVALAGSGPVVTGTALNLTQWRGLLAGSQMTGTLAFTIVTDAPVGSATVSGTFTLTR